MQLPHPATKTKPLIYQTEQNPPCVNTCRQALGSKNQLERGYLKARTFVEIQHQTFSFAASIISDIDNG